MMRRALAMNRPDLHPVLRQHEWPASGRHACRRLHDGPMDRLGWSAVVATATGISAYKGFRDTGRCRDRRALEAPIATAR
jgi:hypothetical protein